MPRFLTIGECMVELAPAGDRLFRMGFAGDTFNTAWYARRLLPEASSVGYCSVVGQDAVSSDMLALLPDAPFPVTAASCAIARASFGVSSAIAEAQPAMPPSTI